jgi:hypothetical protein
MRVVIDGKTRLSQKRRGGEKKSETGMRFVVVLFSCGPPEEQKNT